LSWLLLLVHFYADDRPWTAAKSLLAVTIALTAQVKFSHAVMALPVLAAITFDQLFRRKLPSILFEFLAAYLALWLAAGQPLGALPTYLSRSWLVATGYAQGQEFSLLNETRDTIWFIICAGLIFVAAFIYSWKRDRPPQQNVLAPCRSSIRSAAALAGLAGVMFVLFKAGFIRHDVHQVIGTSGLLLLSLFCLAAMSWRFRSIAGRATFVLAIAACAGLTWQSYDNALLAGPADAFASPVTDFFAQASAEAQWITGAPTLDQINAARLTALRKIPVPPLTGTVDVYPWGQQLILAHDLNYDPRPVFQSYLAFSTPLAQLNAAFLAGPRAPDNILFDVSPIDLRYPAEQDGLSWPEFFSRYDLKDAAGQWLLLTRSPQPRPVSLEPISSVHAKLLQWLDVPDSDDPIWVSFRLHPTILNSIMRAIGKPPVMLLGVTTPYERHHAFRLPVDVADSGFLLSPKITDRMAFADLYSPQWKSHQSEQRVTRIALAIRDVQSSPCFEDDFDVTFSALKFQHSNVSALPGMDSYLRLRETIRQLRAPRGLALPQLTETADGNIVLLAPTPSVIVLPIPPGARTFHFGFGMLNDRYSAALKTDPVEFRLFAQDPSRGINLSLPPLWTGQLNPSDLQQNPGLRKDTVALPDSSAAMDLVLETVLGPSKISADSCWSDLEFR